ncbi:hypothetical protein CFIO01_06878 [Colletotrichum fioriniae PJ7]|uniref:Uncharacterized protein n=1 Tax=Colletotrichum fioriniae PJ7 TaxID=1445577 RepID=A0A010QZ89_9PEZI|nr:hypothetical protein CFIO01_06878 [Colletotrichum fioriniae PJ7]
MQEMIVSTALLFFGLEDLVSAPDAHTTTRWHVRTLLLELWRGFVVRPVLAAIIFISANIDLFNSMLGEVSWLLAILLWGTSKVLSAHYDEEFYANEDKRQPPDKEYSTRWEFGQVLPVLLLAAPLVAIIGTFTSSEKSSKGSRSEDRLEVASSSFENTASSYHRPQQSEGDTWELRTLSTRGRSSAERQHGNDLNYDDSVSVEHSVNQNQGINSRNVFARDYYSEALWMPPYMVVSFMMIWAYIFFLFWYATDAFLVMGRYDNGPAGKMSDSVDYLFDHTTGVFYLILVSYPAAGYSFILFGLTVDEWKKTPRTTLRRFSRRPPKEDVLAGAPSTGREGGGPVGGKWLKIGRSRHVGPVAVQRWCSGRSGSKEPDHSGERERHMKKETGGSSHPRGPPLKARGDCDSSPLLHPDHHHLP